MTLWRRDEMAQQLVFHRFIFVFSMHDKGSECSQDAPMLSMDTVDEKCHFARVQLSRNSG
jgi:hypothetical protein